MSYYDLRLAAIETATHELSQLHANGIIAKEWAEFSHIQQAHWLVIDDQNIARCKRWLETGNNKDAWA